MKQALLIIDYIENCCLEEYKNPYLNIGLSKVREIAKSLEKLLTYFREQNLGNIIWITSCPWIKGYVHPNIERFYNENPESEFYSIKTGGNDFYIIKPKKDEPVFEKNSYSAFSGTQGELSKYLRKQRIDHLIISGIYSTGCVNATICEAFHQGHKLTVIKDCVETFDDQAKQLFQRNLLIDWSYMYGNVKSLSEYIKSM